jgi:hypothetical protein
VRVRHAGDDLRVDVCRQRPSDAAARSVVPESYARLFPR